VSALLLLLIYLLLNLSTALLSRNLTRFSSYPLYVVLFVPLDQIDTLQHVGYVIYAALLHAKGDLRRVQVETLVLLRAKQRNELVRQLDESVFFSVASATVLTHGSEVGLGRAVLHVRRAAGSRRDKALPPRILLIGSQRRESVGCTVAHAQGKRVCCVTLTVRRRQ
jgi:hypothetical protein